MNRNLDRLLADVKRFHRGSKSLLLFDDYKRKIDRAIAPEAHKKHAVLELTRLLQIKPEVKKP